MAPIQIILKVHEIKVTDFAEV